jgi:uncharacterized membrane protein
LNITTVHLPVIIGAIVVGPRMGAALGGVFGLTSLINATFLKPNPIESPIFSPFYGFLFNDEKISGNIWSLVICFVPRILVGLFAAGIFIGMSALLNKIIKNKTAVTLISSGVAGVLGSMTNTILVLSGIYVFFGEPYSAAYGMDLNGLFKAIMGIISLNGLAEAVLAGFLSVALCKPLIAVKNKMGF